MVETLFAVHALSRKQYSSPKAIKECVINAFTPSALKTRS
jgi:hypothetical protein